MKEEYLDELVYSLEGQCQTCGYFGELNDLGLCEECSRKLERDLIRQRHWDYSALCFGLSSEQREKLRSQVISKFGEDYELIFLKGRSKKKNHSRSRKRKKPTT